MGDTCFVKFGYVTLVWTVMYHLIWLLLYVTVASDTRLS